MEPDRDERVGGNVQRANPTVLAAIALGTLLLLIGAMMLFGSRSSEDDRLTGNELAQSSEEPAERCANRATYEAMKREIFRRAAALRGSDQAAFDKIAAYSTVRMESPVLRDESVEVGSVTCNGRLTLDLPPGVAVVGGRRSLSAEVLYTLQPAADASGNVLTIANADEIITPLATLARTNVAAGGDVLPPTGNAVESAAPDIETGGELPPAPPAPTPPPERPAPPAAAQSGDSARPSFNCRNARSSSEIAVCGNPSLASLDRRMAAQFASAFSNADPRQRALLTRTRDSFLTYRNRCTSDDCIAETYRGRMREIRDIMLGRWTPER